MGIWQPLWYVKIYSGKCLTRFGSLLARAALLGGCLFVSVAQADGPVASAPSTQTAPAGPNAVTRAAVGQNILKCASRGWFPSNLQLDVHEVLLPEASGTLLTTGNLEDVTKLAGTITSVKVSGDAHIRGSTVLGTRGEETEIQWNSLLTGRFPLAMGGGGNRLVQPSRSGVAGGDITRRSESHPHGIRPRRLPYEGPGYTGSTQ